MRDGETLVVSKLDRLGRDAMDVMSTVRSLSARRVRVVVHSLGGVDLTSTTGKLLVTMLAAVAEMERDLLVERTRAGVARAKAQGKQIGRPAKARPDTSARPVAARRPCCSWLRPRCAREPVQRPAHSPSMLPRNAPSPRRGLACRASACIRAPAPRAAHRAPCGADDRCLTSGACTAGP